MDIYPLNILLYTIVPIVIGHRYKSKEPDRALCEYGYQNFGIPPFGVMIIIMSDASFKNDFQLISMFFKK